MSSILKNKMVVPKSGIDFSRSLFYYSKRHSSNVLAGGIYPVHTQFVYPGSSYDLRFGCVIESAPLISTCFDNIYVDIVSIWCPMRLAMKDWNEFLGESHSTAFTINRSIKIPKIGTVYVKSVAGLGLTGTGNVSRAYLADHFLAPHLGYRLHDDTVFGTDTHIHAESIFKNGVSVIPSRIYDLNYNTYFRNENLQAPLLIDTTSTVGSYDSTNYTRGLGRIRFANKLKTFYYAATPAPSLLDVPLALSEVLAPVGAVGLQTGTAGAAVAAGLASGASFTKDEVSPFNGISLAGNDSTFAGSIVADISGLTVNKMVYALMEQRFANKMMKGRRMTEFYENFFGIKDSEAGHDMPQLICHKRYPLNISQVIATASGSNGSDTTDLGQRGAFSTTGFGDPFIYNFTATEHGYIQTYLIIRGQESIYQGIDHFLGIDDLLGFYLPEFDHISPVGIERLELNDQGTYSTLYYGYTNPWYAERNQISDVCGIIEPGQPLAYKTLANEPGPAVGVGLEYNPVDMDRLFMFPVHYDTANIGTTADTRGCPYDSQRYQFIVQFAVRGKFAAVMSPDSEPLKLRI